MCRKFSEYTGTTANCKLKAACWHPTKNEGVNPIDISYDNDNKYWFQCDVCPHSFDAEIYTITGENGDWCQYCVNQKLCDENDCEFCYNNSFKSYTGKTANGKLKYDCWHATKNGYINPIDVMSSTNKKYWFKCDNDKCENEDFNIIINSITGSTQEWCPHCDE
jgi:hypothetical protein